MTLNEILNSVYSLTGRPDRVSETWLAVQAATLKAHQSDYYWKDLFECQVSFSSTDYVQNMDYRSIFTLFRAVKYLRYLDTTSSPARAGKFLKYLTPEEVLDGSYKIPKTDIFYTAGAFIQINLEIPYKNFLFGCYLNPNVSSQSAYSSWIALDHPYAIIYDAAATVFKAIGKNDEAADYRNLVAEQIQMLKMSNIEGVGY